MSKQSVSNKMLASDTARANLLTNGGFEIWQRGTGPFTATGAWTTDRWQIALSGTDTVSLARVSAAAGQPGSYALASTFTLGTGAGSSAIYQFLARSDAGLSGQTLSLSIWSNCSTANAVAAYINTNGTGGAEVQSPGNASGVSILRATNTIPSDATYVIVGLRLKASATAYFDNAILVVGSVAADYVPLHPADDMARCQRYFESSNPATLPPGAQGYADAASRAMVANLWWKVQKVVTPTITKVGTFTATNCGQATFDQASLYGGRMYALSSAAGWVVTEPTGSAYMTVEANP